jgi:hypothetical protein
MAPGSSVTLRPSVGKTVILSGARVVPAREVGVCAVRASDPTSRDDFWVRTLFKGGFVVAGEIDLTGYSITTVEPWGEDYIRKYEFKAGPDGRVIAGEPESMGEKFSPELGDRIRILIIGSQRVSISDADSNNKRELEFANAKEALNEVGYEGIYVRFAPFEPNNSEDGKTGVRLLPDGIGPVPTDFWQQEVKCRMEHCRGVALLDGADSSLAVQWEIKLAEALGKPVRPLAYWLRRSRRRKA